jgi:hypothetical protein
MVQTKFISLMVFMLAVMVTIAMGVPSHTGTDDEQLQLRDLKRAAQKRNVR